MVSREDRNRERRRCRPPRTSSNRSARNSSLESLDSYPPTRSPSPVKKSVRGEENWPFWWLGAAAALAVVVTAAPSPATLLLTPTVIPSTDYGNTKFFAPPLQSSLLQKEKAKEHETLWNSRALQQRSADMIFEPNFDDEHFFDAFKMRPRNRGGLRYRDEETMIRLAVQYAAGQRVSAFPVLVSDRPRIGTPSSTAGTTTSGIGGGGNNGGTGGAGGLSLSQTPSSNRRSEPTLEDFDLIDVLWRRDIEAEKGGGLTAAEHFMASDDSSCSSTTTTTTLSPHEQYERDLQLLTEKSIQAPLTHDEAARFEDLSKAYYEDFYAPTRRAYGGTINAKSESPSDGDSGVLQSLDSSASSEGKQLLPTPTDADLNALFEEMVKDGGELERALFSDGNSQSSSGASETSPLLRNVSLSSAVVAPFSNLTEVEELRSAASASSRAKEASLAPFTAPPPPTTSLSNATSGFPEPTQFWFVDTTGPESASAISTYQSREPVLNMSTLVLPPLENVQTIELQRASSPPMRVSLSNDSSSVYSSGGASSSSASPNHSGRSSEAENRAPTSRMYGKLAPIYYDKEDEDEDGEELEEEDDEGFHDEFRGSSRGDRRPFSVGSRSTPSAAPSSSSTVPSGGVRRRGRQSKDEQLAAAAGLPASAAAIADMTLPDLQRMLKSHDLNEAQKQLIRKIRRRGKNKVAARTCRQRRGVNRSSQVDSNGHHIYRQPTPSMRIPFQRR